VSIAAERDGEHWRFSVSDNGIGMSPDHAKRIFEPFQRLHGEEDYPGTGIGLAVCERIIDQHGGRIWVSSRPGEGSVFHFTLPAAAAARVPAPRVGASA
jgi:signal transduction histidine kinase